MLFARRVFQSTPSGGKATIRGEQQRRHRAQFQSTPSGGKATLTRGAYPSRAHRFQSTPSGGKATHRLARADRADRSFNPRLPGGRRHRIVADISSPVWFQSTPSGGKATVREWRLSQHAIVSIHAFRGEGDVPVSALRCGAGVSIHAFRGEGDPPAGALFFSLLSFNPRLPGGRRLTTSSEILLSPRFQSTPSGGKATVIVWFKLRHEHVSIHAFRGEGDSSS